MLENKTLLSSNILHRNPLNFPKIQMVVLTYSLMLGTSNMAILIFLMSIPFVAFFKLYPIIYNIFRKIVVMAYCIVFLGNARTLAVVRSTQEYKWAPGNLMLSRAETVATRMYKC